MDTDKNTWTTYGLSRGGCGHEHRTLGLARRCLGYDRARCSRVGVVSDRKLLQVASGVNREKESQDAYLRTLGA